MWNLERIPGILHSSEIHFYTCTQCCPGGLLILIWTAPLCHYISFPSVVSLWLCTKYKLTWLSLSLNKYSTWLWTLIYLFIFLHPVVTPHCLCACDVIHAHGLWIQQAWKVFLRSARILLALVPLLRSHIRLLSSPLLSMQPICDLPFIASLYSRVCLFLPHTYTVFPSADTCLSHLHCLTFSFSLHAFSFPPLS